MRNIVECGIEHKYTLKHKGTFQRVVYMWASEWVAMEHAIPYSYIAVFSCSRGGSRSCYTSYS